jgi:hypothetical protein
MYSNGFLGSSSNSGKHLTDSEEEVLVISEEKRFEVTPVNRGNLTTGETAKFRW